MKTKSYLKLNVFEVALILCSLYSLFLYGVFGCSCKCVLWLQLQSLYCVVIFRSYVVIIITVTEKCK